MKAIIVVTIGNRYTPNPISNPIADTTHRLAAVVNPLTSPFVAIMLPAPMKLIPVTIPAAILVESKLPSVPSFNKYNEDIVKRHAPMHTNICVRNPAGLWLISRSYPIIAPNNTAIQSLIINSMSCSLIMFSNIISHPHGEIFFVFINQPINLVSY